MKKLYSLVAALMAVCSVWASTPMKALHFSADEVSALDKIGIDASMLKPATNLPNYEQTLQKINQRHKSKAKAEATTTDVLADYSSMGSAARAVSPLLNNIGATTETFNVDLYVHNTEVGKYAVPSPLKNSTYSSIFTASDDVLEINATNSERVYLNTIDLCTFTGEYEDLGTIGLMSLVDYYSYYGYTIDELIADETASSMFGTFNDGVITLPAYSLLLYFSGYMYYIAEDYTIIFPGKKYYHSAITATDSYITESSEVNIRLSLGGDITSAKYVIIEGFVEAEDEDFFKKIADPTNASQVGSLTRSTTFYNVTGSYLSSDKKEHTPISVVLAGLDSDGNYVQGEVFQFFYQPDESANWKSIGTGYYTDGLISDLAGVNSSSLSLFFLNSVEIEENVNYPGYLRIVNPYKNDTAFINSSYTDVYTDQDYYLYLIVSEGNPVSVEFSAPGVEVYGNGIGVFGSVTYYLTSLNAEISDDYLATWDKETNRITFPAYSMMASFPYFENGVFMTTNYNGKFGITLPEGYEAAGVNDIVTDNSNAPVEYYNLQGVRIENPTPGQLVIRRQGGTSTKMLVK